MHPMSERAQDLKLRNDFALLINGELINSRQSLEVINPATEKIFAVCPAAERDHQEKAVEAAKLAFGDWSRTSFEERADYIRH